MKISLNWIHDYISTTLTPEDLETKLTDLGLECVVEVSPLKFTDVVLGYVRSCEAQPNSDHLSVCQVDIGAGQLYSVVCGAPNVRQGINVPVAKVGAKFNDGEFTIKKSKLRGVVSEGMICSGKELGFNADEKGILILDTQAALGTPIEQVLDFGQDAVFDIDLTPDRGDCLSHLGTAREISIIEGRPIRSRKTALKEGVKATKDLIKVTISDPEGCPRYAARIVNGVTVGPSPQWLADRMTSIGQKSINNVVDAANFILMDTGHPMHTFDLDEIKSGEIVVRRAGKGEKITLLDETVKELGAHHLLICDGKTPVALAGIMGGLGSGISENTQNILIESAYFDPAVIRKGAKSLDLATEASHRFERGTDIENVTRSLDQLAALIAEVAGGEVTRGIVDNYPKPLEKTTITFSTERCNRLLGTELTTGEIEKIFSALSIDFQKQGNDYLCNVPSYRNDLEREVDLIEEIARVFGYNNLPISGRFSGSYLAFIPDKHELDKKIRTLLHPLGFNEHTANSLVPETETSLFSDVRPVKLTNPISSEMACLRTSLLPGMLKAVAFNINRRSSFFKLYEFGAVHEFHEDSATKSLECFRLGMAWYGKTPQHWRKLQAADFFHIKGELLQLFSQLGCRRLRMAEAEAKGFRFAVSIFSGKHPLGVLGYPDRKIKDLFDIGDEDVIVFEGRVDDIAKALQVAPKKYTAPSQYPAVHRDIAILVKKTVTAEQLLRTIRSAGGDLLKEITLFDLYESDEMGQDQKSLAFGLIFQSETKSLQAKVVDKLIEKIIKNLARQHQAVQR
ncbi:MAG: phenylalanine--tRNA ligase subunit beta [FCB group bacterium]|nr:phenylalanine--tRNA ligase subunit beta [FCB group bacterium]